MKEFCYMPKMLKLEKDRNTAQYDPVEKIQAEEAKKGLQKAVLFCDTIQKLIDNNIAKLE
jgi:uncharacterized protein (UPF0332 family)